MPHPEGGTQAKEVLRMIDDFRSNKEAFFSRGYLNSDGRKAILRLLRAALQIAFDLKGYSSKKYKRGSESDIDAILSELESRLSDATGSFKYRSGGTARTHE